MTPGKAGARAYKASPRATDIGALMIRIGFPLKWPEYRGLNDWNRVLGSFEGSLKGSRRDPEGY